MISIVNVEVSQDLKNAKIYLSFYDDSNSNKPSEYFKFLKKSLGQIKFKIGNSLKTKYVPNIKFFLSDEFEYYDKISRILKND